MKHTSPLRYLLSITKLTVYALRAIEKSDTTFWNDRDLYKLISVREALEEAVRGCAPKGRRP